MNKAPNSVTKHDPLENEVISLKDFAEKEELFQIEIKHLGKVYTVDIGEIFETDINWETGTINELSANRIICYALGLRNEFNTIMDNLLGEQNEVELNLEFFLARKTKEAEDKIIEERKKLIEEKKKKEIGIISQSQVMNYIINTYEEDYRTLISKKRYLERVYKKLEKLDRILAHRIDRLNDMLTRQRKNLGTM